MHITWMWTGQMGQPGDLLDWGVGTASAMQKGEAKVHEVPHGKGPGRLAFRGGVELSQVLLALAVHNWFPHAGWPVRR